MTTRCAWMLLLGLALPAGSALAGDDGAAASHWSGLPIWGAEAEARGFVLPAPFGIALTAYSAEQPVDIQDLRLGRNGAPPVSVIDILQIDQVDTTQRNASAKFDVLVLPFLDVYGLAGYTEGTTRGVIQIPGSPGVGIIEPRQLRLDAGFGGPTYGVGATVQGGARVSADSDLMVITVIDWNRTRTELEFDNQALIAETRPQATVLSARLGLHGSVGATMTGAVWIGAMHQTIQQTVAGGVSGTDLQFVVQQSPARPWNTLIGALLELGDDGGYVLVEGGVGARRSLLLSAVYRF